MTHFKALVGLVSSCALLATTPVARADEKPSTAKPNFVVFIADDHGYLDSSVYGASDVKTPNLQRLAREGRTFTHMFVASPSCAPSRAALLTGLMPARNGAEANHTYPREGVKGLLETLRSLGYETASFGKVAHAMSDPRTIAARFGFDHHNNRRDPKTVEEFLSARKKDRPLCLFVGTSDPHLPWPENQGYDSVSVKVPPTHVDTPETRAYRTRYYTAVTRADDLLGKVYDLTRKHLEPKQTVFVYMSDHGAQWPFGKWNLYDAGIRIPFLVAWPEAVKPGTRSDALLSSVDLLPTFIELAGGAAPREIDGRSFASVLLAKADTHREQVFATHSADIDWRRKDRNWNVYPIRSVRTKEYKYILNLHPEYAYTTHNDLAGEVDGVTYWRSWLMLARDDARAAAVVQRYQRRPREELYDLTRDPHEQQNLAGDPAHAERLARLRQSLKDWMKAQDDKERVYGEPHLLVRSFGKHDLSEVPIRDPFILPIAKEKVYWLYGSTATDPRSLRPGFDAYRSTDLKTWEGPFPVFRPAPSFWGTDAFWAAEVHLYQGSYYMFATFKGAKRFRGTQILKAEKPEGPFVPLTDGPITPAHWECLDGTLYVDEGKQPWIVFCHEWTQIQDGAMYAMKLTADLKAAVGRPVLLFNASQAPWARALNAADAQPERGHFPTYITDGPFLHRTASGDLLMLWSSKGAGGYTLGVARSSNGKVDGEWRHDAEPLWKADGGHGMLFRTFDRELLLTFHTPNQRLDRARAVIYRVTEEKANLKLGERWRP
jgi:arylsulfatase A-like enzyme